MSNNSKVSIKLSNYIFVLYKGYRLKKIKNIYFFAQTFVLFDFLFYICRELTNILFHFIIYHS